MGSKKFLVPTDFTPVGDCAVNHAVRTAEIIGGKVYLLHVVSKSSELEGAKVKLAKEIERQKSLSHNIPFEPVARIGNIFEDIGETAEEIGVELIFRRSWFPTGIKFFINPDCLIIL